MRFGCCAGLDVLEETARAGFDYIEPETGDLLPRQCDADFRSVRRFMEAAPIRPEVFRRLIPDSLRLMGEDPDFQQVRRYILTVLERAAAVGGKIVVFDSGQARLIPEGFPPERAFNQITGFFIGAMARARGISLAEVAARGGAAYAVVAPDDPEAMARHCREAKQAGVPLVFDPSFQVIAMDGETLRAAADGAYAVILNDYEFAVLQEKTGLAEKELRRLAELWVVTYGEKGSDILRASGERIPVPACPVTEVVDPTGAGDAFRGGFVTGLLRGAELPVCGRMGAVAAAFCIERYGTQSHRYGRDEFWARYEQAFG